jgi:hypothetical protein
MTNESKISTAELKRENRQLREAIECLCDCLEDTQNAPNPERAREAVGRAKSEDRIAPPWEREGYESKEAWLDAQE